MEDSLYAHCGMVIGTDWKNIIKIMKIPDKQDEGR